MAGFHSRRKVDLWEVPGHLQRKDKNDPSREVTLFTRLLSRNYVAAANSGKPEAVLKIVSTGMGKGAFSSIANYISRNAEYMQDEDSLSLENEDGEIFSNSEEIKNIVNDWGDDFASPTEYASQAWKIELRQQLDFERDKLQYYAEKRSLDSQEKTRLSQLNRALKEQKIQQNGKLVDFHLYAPKDVTHIILSVGGNNHNLKRATEATRRFLQENFDIQGYRYAFVAHADTENLHFHVIFKNRNELTGKYVNFDKADLFTLRQDFAHHLELMGIKRVATLRRDRVVTMQAILEQKEQLFEHHKNFKNKQIQKKPINVQKYREQVLKRTDYLLNNVKIELEYSSLTPTRAKKLKETKASLQDFRQELRHDETQQTPASIERDRQVTGKQLQRETKQNAEREGKLTPLPTSKRHRKSMQKYLEKFEKEVKYAMRIFKAQARIFEDKNQIERSKTAFETLKKLHKQTKKLRKSYGWRLGLKF